MPVLNDERLMKVFNSIDKNNNGSLDKQEMITVVANTGESRSDHNIKLVLSAAFKEMETNTDGLVSIVEWKTYFNRKEAAHGEAWAENYFSALEHVILEPLQPVLIADGYHGTSTPEGRLTKFMLKHNKERLKDIRIFSSQYAAKNNQEREEFMKVLNQALMDKYGEDMDNFDAVPEPPISFTDKGLTDLLNAFWTKHNLEKIDEVDTFAAQHDKLDTWAEQEEFMVNLNVALRDKYGEDLDSFGSQKLGSLLTAFFKKHNHEKLKDVSHLEHGHDDLETDEERHEYLVTLNAALMEKYGEDLSCVAAVGLWLSAKDPVTGDIYWFQADGTSTWDDPYATAPAVDVAPTKEAAVPAGIDVGPANAGASKEEERAPDVVPEMMDAAVVEAIVTETPTSPETVAELPEIKMESYIGDDQSLVSQIEAAIAAEHEAMESAPSAGVKTTHLKTEARLRRWHGTITSQDKDESSKALARNLAEAFLARVKESQSLGGGSK